MAPTSTAAPRRNASSRPVIDTGELEGMVGVPGAKGGWPIGDGWVSHGRIRSEACPPRCYTPGRSSIRKALGYLRFWPRSQQQAGVYFRAEIDQPFDRVETLDVSSRLLAVESTARRSGRGVLQCLPGPRPLGREFEPQLLAKLGFVATSSSEGAGKWGDMAKWFKGRHVIILPDNDAPGRQHGEQVARNLDPVVASLKVVNLPNLPLKGDVKEWLTHDLTGAQLVQECQRAAAWHPSAEMTTGAQTDEEFVTGLAALSKLEYAKRRKEAAATIGITVADLDRLVLAERPDGDVGKKGRGIEFPEPKPWDGPVDGAVLLDSIAAAIGRHVVMREHSRDVAALWVIHTYLLDCFFVSSRLAIHSPVKRCGKTTTLDVIGRLVLRPLPTANVTPAAVFRVVEAYRPTLLVDEADTFLRKNDELRGVINSGHRKGGSVLRTVGDGHEPRAFSTYSACAIVLIGKLPDTLHDRSLVINLKRRLPSERIEQFRPNRAGHLDELTSKIARWAQDHEIEIAEADPEMPPDIFNREADNWAPLLAVADVAGGHWPDRARKAVLQCHEEAGDESLVVVLLADVNAIFAEQETDRLSSADLAKILGEIEGHPWSEYGRTGKPLTQNQLARLLKPLAIASENIRVGDK